MTTSTVWYITSEPDYDYLQLSVKTMHGYDWVTNIVIMHTDPDKPKHVGRLESEYDKVSEFWKSYGYGFDKSCKEGGFDEIICRNETIQIAKSMGDEWLIQCDSDEFFTSWLGELFLNISVNNHDAFAMELSCYHFISPLIYIWDTKTLRGVMHDGHIRVVRHNHLPYYAFRKLHKIGDKTGRVFSDGRVEIYLNDTQDSGVTGVPKRNIFYEPEPCHIHVHDMFHKTDRIAYHKLSSIDEDYKLIEKPRDIFPDHYIQAYVDCQKTLRQNRGIHEN